MDELIASGQLGEKYKNKSREAVVGMLKLDAYNRQKREEMSR